MFADFWNMFLSKDKSQSEVNTKGKPYLIYLITITFVPMMGLAYRFVAVQKLYAVLGSLVIPFISLVLLLLNRQKETGSHANKISTDILLVLIILFFVYTGLPEIYAALFGS